jgi:hypothetical protein
MNLPPLAACQSARHGRGLFAHFLFEGGLSIKPYIFCTEKVYFALDLLRGLNLFFGKNSGRDNVNAEKNIIRILKNEIRSYVTV